MSQSGAHTSNPTASTTTLEMSGLSSPGPVQLDVLKRSAQPRAGILREQFDLMGLVAGVYSVRVFTPQGTVVKRLVRE